MDGYLGWCCWHSALHGNTALNLSFPLLLPLLLLLAPLLPPPPLPCDDNTCSSPLMRFLVFTALLPFLHRSPAADGARYFAPGSPYGACANETCGVWDFCGDAAEGGQLCADVAGHVEGICTGSGVLGTFVDIFSDFDESPLSR